MSKECIVNFWKIMQSHSQLVYFTNCLMYNLDRLSIHNFPSSSLKSYFLEPIPNDANFVDYSMDSCSQRFFFFGCHDVFISAFDYIYVCIFLYEIENYTKSTTLLYGLVVTFCIF